MIESDEVTTESVATTTNTNESSAVENPVEDKPRRHRSTSHLKLVPETLELREHIRLAAESYTKQLDKSRPFNKSALEAHSRKLLEQIGQPEGFLGFTMVLIGNAFWKQQFLAIPFERRLLLLPHCLKHAEGCPADYDEFGLDCEKCGACSIADYKVRAEQLGYKVLVAAGPKRLQTKSSQIHCDSCSISSSILFCRTQQSLCRKSNLFH